MMPDQTSSRFRPTEGARQVVENADTHQSKLAGEVSFSPVATINHDSKSVYVKPVQNMHQRAVSTAVIGTTGKVAVRGERMVELSSDLHSQLKAKVNSAVANLAPQTQERQPQQKYVNSADLKTEVVVQIKPISQIPVQRQAQLLTSTATMLPINTPPSTTALPKPTPAPTPTQATLPSTPVVKLESTDLLKNQLDQINQILFEQIKQKVASELARQEKAVKMPLQQKPAALQVAEKEVGKTVNTTTTPAPIPAQTQRFEPKPSEQLKPTAVVPNLPVKTVLTPNQHPIAVEKPKTLPQPSSQDYRSQIDKLEAEIKILTKEVSDLDKTVESFAAEKNVAEIATLERRIEVDQKMLAAIAEWRLALNNLINSHTLALKYLKEKTDWLAEASSHAAKHENLHRKPLETIIEAKLTTNPVPILESQPVLPKPEQVTPTLGQEPTNTVQKQLSPQSNTGVGIQASAEIKPIEIPVTQPTSAPAQTVYVKEIDKATVVPENAQTGVIIKEPTAVPDNKVVESLIQEGLKEGIAKPDATAVNTLVQEAFKTQTTKPDEKAVDTMVQEALKQQLPSVVKEVQPNPVVEKEVQTPSFEAVRDLVKQALEKEKVQTTKTDSSAVDTMVRQALKEQLPSAVKDNQPTSAPAQTVYVKEVDKATSIPENALTGMLIKEQTTGPIQITMSSSDIEKQILEAATKEEDVKEIARHAKELAAKKAAEEHQKKDQVVVEAANKAATGSTTQVVISPEILKTEFDRLKASLTTVDNQHLAAMNKDQRTEMIRKLQNLEKDTTISKQFDEIKANAERRRINNELSAMLHQLGEKAPEPAAPTQNPAQKMEALKTETVKQTTPAQKAHLIAEIKELERQTQARKAVERSRPAVKAQPAFGKMLPNTPTVPNVINGIVKDAKGLLLSTVVIIVKDTEGEPVRAFKTNKLGQFALSTPVPNGTYRLELEKEGYEFDIIEVEVNGSIMQPIEIKAR